MPGELSTKKPLKGKDARTKAGIRENTLRLMESQKPLKKARAIAKGLAHRPARRKMKKT